MHSHVYYACFVCILAGTSLLYLQLDKFDIREQVFITVKSTILVFKVLISLLKLSVTHRLNQITGLH